MDHIPSREYHFICSGLRGENIRFLGDRLCEPCLCITPDCYSCVSVVLLFEAGSIFPNLIEGSSAAIWNKDKIVVGIAGAVWLTNVAASTEGKSSALSSYRTSYKRDHASGVSRVNKLVPNTLDSLGLCTCSSAPNGTSCWNNA
jgi:hypothetical protein